MQKYLFSLYLLLGTIALYSQEVTKIANFDLFTWQEKPCKYDTKKKNHLRVDNGEMRIVSKSYPEINSFVLKEIEAGDKYHVFTAHNIKAIRTDHVNFFFNDTIIQRNNQLVMIRLRSKDKQHQKAKGTRFKILTQIDSTHWTITNDGAFQRVLFKDVLNAFKADTLQSYINHLDMDYMKLDHRFLFPYHCLIELVKQDNQELFKITRVEKGEYLTNEYILPIFDYTVSKEWLIMHLFLQRAWPGGLDYVPYGKYRYRNRFTVPGGSGGW